MTKEDPNAALFAEPNPVPSLDMLEPLDIDPLESRSKRSSVMTDPTTDQLKPVNRGRWPRLAFLAAVPVVIVAGLLFLGDRNRNVATTPGAPLTDAGTRHDCQLDPVVNALDRNRLDSRRAD